MDPLPESSSKRLPWLDIARGIGIILVVIGHIGEGIINSGIPYPRWIQLIVGTIYTFHMPLFFWISGFLFLPSFTKHPESFIRLKAGTILYPYLVWTIIQTLIEVGLGAYTNKGISISELYPILWAPRAHFWYLHALFLISLFNYFVFKYWPKLALLLGFGLYLINRLNFMDIGYFSIPINNLLYFNLGILFWQNRQFLLAHIHKTSFILGMTSIFFLAEAYYLPLEFKPVLIGILITLLGTTWVLSVSGFPYPQWKSKVLVYLGENSLYIYLLHVLTGSGVRIVLDKFMGIENAEIHLTLGVIAGIIIPLVITEICRRMKWMKMFGW